jgi:hypothetical protein
LCEIATNEKFEKLMADAEIYVDGIATMRFTDLNASLADARSAILAEHPEAAGDRILQTLEAAQIDEEDFSAMSHIRRGTLSCAISEKPMRATRTQSTPFFPTMPDISATVPKYTGKSTPKLRNI